MKTFLSKKEQERFYEEREKYKKYCKCGHYAYIVNKSGIAECSWCHNLIFKDKETEFKFRMKQNLIKEKRNNK